jgi:glycosyltransferase involved in cell wall biosynthesis
LKFSVALCTYNGARHVGEQLASFAAQTRPPFELVVCDDRSTDETVRAVREFAESAPFPVRLFVNERNLGSTKNFGRAIELCEGELIALSDQDDVWDGRKLERLGEEFERDAGVGLVFTDAEVVDESLRPLGYTVFQSLDFDSRARAAFAGRRAAFESLLARNVVTGATMAFRAKFKRLVLPLCEAGGGRYGAPEWSLIHDGWIALLVAAAAGVMPVAEPLIKYRQHPRQQLGINAPKVDAADSAQGWRERAGARYKDYFASELEFLETVRGRLAEGLDEFDSAAALAGLGARISHLSARASMPASRLRRAPRVLRELVTLRYFRYSNGVSSAAKDILL